VSFFGSAAKVQLASSPISLVIFQEPLNEGRAKGILLAKLLLTLSVTLFSA